MRKNRTEDADMRAVAKVLGVETKEVRRAVESFFAPIVKDARSLPFDNARKIYTKERFDELVVIRNIPYIGRIGPVYSRYLKWRANEYDDIVQKPRSSYRSRISQDDIEHMADEILSGKTPTPLRKKRNSEMFNRVWLVGKNGKKQARQVIPKEEDNGI